MTKEFNMNKSWKKRKIATNTINTAIKKGLLSTTILGVGSLIASTVYAAENNATNNINIALTNTPTNAKVIHVDGTNKLILDFDNAGDLSSELKPSASSLIDSVSSQKSGEKLRVGIDTKQPVTYALIQNGKDVTLRLTPAKEFSEEKIASPVINTASNTPALNTSNTSIASTITTTEIKTETKVDKPEAAVAAIATATPQSVSAPLTNPVAATNPVPAQVLTQPLQGEVEHINLKAQGKVAKLTIDLNDRSLSPVISQSGNLLIIDLPGVTIPDEFQKNISTTNLGTVVKNMDVATRKGSGRIVLDQGDNWTYSTYQMDKKVVVEIKPATNESTQETYKGKPLTLNFQNMDVRAILQVIADFTGLNIMSSDSVSGAMTVRLKDVPWDQALDLVLEAKNLQKQKTGNVVWVATRQEIADKNKSQLELNNQAADLAPLKLEFFQLNHYKAKEMKEIIEGKTTNGSSGGSSGSSGSSGSTNSSDGFALLSKRGSVGLDIRNNTIFVQDTEARLEEIRKIIKRLDIASKQVLIEAKLVVVDDKFERDLGAKFAFALGKKNNSTGIGLSNNSSDATGVATGNGTSGSVFNLPVTGGGSIGFTILNAVTGNMLNVELSALEQNNRGKVISNPRLLTADNKKAEIRQGTEIPYVTPGSANSPATVSFKDAVLSLGVTPQVSPNGRVSMDLDISKDTVGQLVNVQGGGQVPSIDTRKITTQVTVNDGQTVVLGGIYEVTSREDLSKVPLLGDIPWVGNFFKNTSRSNEKVELLIFITPHVISEADLDAINKNEQINSTEVDLKKK